MVKGKPRVVAVDLFCGAGGLSYGLRKAGISIAAGIDIDPACQYPFESNIEAPFLQLDVRDVTADHLRPLWRGADIKALAGCAPCQPFSPYRRGQDTSDEAQWPLLDEFARLIEEGEPDVVTMENVPRVGSSQVFQDFLSTLSERGYATDFRSCNTLDFGLAQRRRRLVLLASKVGPVAVPVGDPTKTRRTVRDEIGELPALEAGQSNNADPMHRSRGLSAMNLKRIKASSPGGTWQDWPADLRSPCHRKSTGSTYRNVYARMEWDKPAPTITTLAYNFGTGRFGHPEQDRGITLREAAMLQGFPRKYRFVRPEDPVRFATLGRLIGNAVPPPLAEAVGEAIMAIASQASNPEGIGTTA